MKRICIFSMVLSLLGVSCIYCNLSHAKDVSETDVKRIEAEARKKSIESRQLQAKALQLNLELSKIDKTVINLAQEIQNNEDKISELENKLVVLKEDLKLKEAAFTKENQSLVQTLASLQNMSLNPSEAVILQPFSPVDVIRSAILLRETVPFLNNKSAKLRTDLDAIYTQKQQVENTVIETKNSQKKLEQQQKEMRSLMQKKTSMRKVLETRGAETQKEAENLASKAKDLRDLLVKLEKQKELARKKQEEAERLAALKRQEEMKKLNAQQQRTISQKEHDSIKKQVKGGRFARAKGTLSRPVRGNVITEYGQPLSKGVTSKGIVYKTRPNAQVISLYDGTVIFSGPFKGYGNIIIVEHGDGYLSLLAGLGVIDCELGQMLLAGEPVGTMPDSSNAKLYVEIRKDRHPINPTPWIAS